MQQAVDDYHKLFQAEGTKSWNDTWKFFIKEDLKATDNFQALVKAGIGSAHSTITDKRINQLQSHTSGLLERNAMYKKALTDMAHVVNTIQTNQLSAAPSVAAPASESKNEM